MSLYKEFILKSRNSQLKNKLLDKRFDLSQIDASKKGILIIDSIIPEFDKDSGSRRLYELIKLIVKHGLQVFLVADIKEYKYKTEYVKHYTNLGVLTYEPMLDAHGDLVTREIFIEAVVPYVQFAWLHRPDVFEKYFRMIKRLNTNCHLIYDMVDFHYLRLFREWQQTGNPKLKKEADSHLKMELQNCDNADHIVVISETDKQSLKMHYPNDSKMIVIGNIHEFVVKNADFKTFSERSGLFFIGGFKHLPNIDAVHFLHDDIMPLVWKKQPEIKMIIVGSYPTEAMLKLNTEQFVVEGFVRDIGPYYQNARLLIAPLRFGAGIKGKIGQSFEYGLPVITTDVGAEGFDFGIFQEQMIANAANEIADKIIDLYTNELLWNNVSDYSKVIIEPFSIAQIEVQLKELLEL